MTQYEMTVLQIDIVKASLLHHMTVWPYDCVTKRLEIYDCVTKGLWDLTVWDDCCVAV